MFPPPHTGLRTCALAVAIAAGLASPRVVEHLVTRADSRPQDLASSGEGVAQSTLPANSHRLRIVPLGTPTAEAPPCTVTVAYRADVSLDRRVALTDVVSDQACPLELNTTVGLTFEIDNPEPRRSLWWRRAESSFDVLYPSSGSIAAAGKNRVRLRNLVLDQTVTIEVREGDQRLMAFTLKHF
jgi:hypothetical protein